MLREAVRWTATSRGKYEVGSLKLGRGGDAVQVDGDIGRAVAIDINEHLATREAGFAVTTGRESRGTEIVEGTMQKHP